MNPNKRGTVQLIENRAGLSPAFLLPHTENIVIYINEQSLRLHPTIRLLNIPFLQEEAGLGPFVYSYNIDNPIRHHYEKVSGQSLCFL